MKKLALTGLLVIGLALTGCGGPEETTGDPNAISGDITVLTQRTDLVDNVFVDYKKNFETKYPGVHVKFEAITDYETEVRIRMNTQEYGDVLLIPNSITADQLPT